MPIQREVPQPGPERIEPVTGHPLVVGIVPDQPDVVALTAASWARAMGSSGLVFAYVDESRVVDEEYPDGRVRHSAFNPDELGESWVGRQQRIEARLAKILQDEDVAWQFRYLAGRPDRALTHLARAVNAPAFVIGARLPRRNERLYDFVSRDIGLHLARHQHRPVLLVPTSVVDWKAPTPWS